ncbi:MAG: sugar kinase [Candidatus Hydrothermarchaeota archaeon]
MALTLDIISIGECMVEFFCEGGLGEAELFRKAYGGDTLNTLVAAARLGSRTGYITRVGRDPFARFLLSSWEREGIDITHAPLMEGFNGIYFISLVAGGGREFTYYRKGSAASTLDPRELDRGYISGARILHSSGITQALSRNNREYVLDAFKTAREAGVKVSYDTNLRTKLWDLEAARAGLEEVLAYVDIFLPSAEELEVLLGLEGREAVAEHFSDLVEVVAVKEGMEGATVIYKGEVRHIPPLDVEVVDTTGAGDAFNGGFLHAIASGLDPFKAAEMGVVTAGLKVRGRGAVASLPRKGEVEAHLRGSTTSRAPL